MIDNYPSWSGSGPQSDDNLENEQIGPVYTQGVFDTFKQAAEEGFDASPLNKWIQTAKLVKEDLDPTSPLVTDDEIKSLTKNRPGLNIPKQSTQEAANLLIKNYDHQTFINSFNDLKDPTLLGKISNFAGSAFGSMIGDPLGTAAIFATDDLVGARAGETKELLNNTIAQKIKSGVKKDVAIGALVSAPQFTQDINDHDPDAVMNAMLNIAGFSILSRAYHGIKGKVGKALRSNSQLISNDADTAARSVAATQMMNGKNVDVSAQIKQGLHDQQVNILRSLNENNITKEQATEELTNNKDENLAKIDEINKNINEIQSKKTLTDEDNKNLSGLNDKLEDLHQIDSTHDLLLDALHDDRPFLTKEDSDEFIKKINTHLGDFYDYEIPRPKEFESIEPSQLKDLAPLPEKIERAQELFPKDSEIKTELEDPINSIDKEDKKTFAKQLIEHIKGCLHE